MDIDLFLQNAGNILPSFNTLSLPRRPQ